MASRDGGFRSPANAANNSLVSYQEGSFALISSSASAGSTTSSTYRHHRAAFQIPHPSTPKPVLMTDVNHKPKTRGSVGILIVGLGGAHGATLLAGIVANRHKLHWRGPKGEQMTPNYYGCITQIDHNNNDGRGTGYHDRIKGLADASMAAVGGWDIRPTKVGDALLDAQVLDYDLVRQVKDELNKTKVFRGVYDPHFVDSSQHHGATHALTKQEASNSSETLKCLRADIRYFKWRNGVVGHTTVIWSATVEPNCELVEKLRTARDLLDSIEMIEEKRGGPLPPSLLYATAALLEGCSFVNGTSQNTLSCEGLIDLARQQLGVYCLGTDFKSGQTKFQTTVVECIRTMGLTPKVMATFNHTGNNDIKKASSPDLAMKARLQGGSNDMIVPWEEDKGRKVGNIVTPFVNDDKRNFVEYTSLGFLGQPYTMVTYSRSSDSILCVPLMIDVAVWCDYFSNRSWPYEKVAKALAYLFNIPEGAAKGTDSGFFQQMEELNTQAHAAYELKGVKHKESVKKRVRIRPEEKTTEWAIPHDAKIICAGLACVDMQLNHATGGDGGESIETFEGEKSIGGGSVSMACKTLARLCHGAPLDDGFMQVTPPVVHSVVPLCMVGNDDTGNKLLSLLEGCGEASRNVETKFIRKARKFAPSARTALAVLPIYRDGRRGCFFDAASNATFSPHELIELIQDVASGTHGPDLDTSHMSMDDMEDYLDRIDGVTPACGAFLFGYPHLLPKMQGKALASIFVEARNNMIDGGIVALDLNGVPGSKFPKNGWLRKASDLKNDPVIGAALEHVDILHMNEDELKLLTGCKIEGTEASRVDDEFAIASAANLFLSCGVAIVAVTRGKKGSFVSCGDDARFRKSGMLPSSWVDCTARINAVELPRDTVINTNGAGDAFTSGLLVAAMLRHTGMTVPMPKESRSLEVSDRSLDLDELEINSPTAPLTQTRLTPYQLYMRENYVSLKQQCNDDKKAIFTKCHEMWENETEGVKLLYERKANEDYEEVNEISMRLVDDLEAMDSTPRGEANHSYDDSEDDDEVIRNVYMTNRALNLESAVQFASLVAAYHVDASTRDLLHIDVLGVLERALIVPLGLEEI